MPVEGLSALVKSPGVPSQADQVEAARAAGVPVWSEVELAARMLPNPIAGVTGTNGKTTTTELLGAMLRAGGIASEVAGNVGRPLSALAGRIDAGTWIACELSSFQLEDIDTLRCRIGVLLNVTPDHLDRHGSFDQYLRCKLRIFENQRPGDTAVVNGDDPPCAARSFPGTASASRSPGPMRTRSTGSTPASAATTTSRTRSRRPPRPGPPASTPPTSTAPCASSRRCRTGSSPSPAPRASSS